MTTIDTSTEAVLRLLEDVTPGPWTEHDAGKHPHVFVCGPDELYYNGEVKDKPLIAYVTGVGAIENRAFITAARDLVPALLKERDEARAALAASQPADPVTNAGCCQPVKVKPLEWRNSYGVLRAETLFGDYKITRHILKLLSGSEQVHDDTEAAKAAAQADYEARILAAIEPAPRVNETPKREHDSADVLTAVTLAGAAHIVREAISSGQDPFRLATNAAFREINCDGLVASVSRIAIALEAALRAIEEGKA